MKLLKIVTLFFFMSIAAQTQTIVFEGINVSTSTTGKLLEGVTDAGITSHVVEIPGLLITARSTENNHFLNSNLESFGINAPGGDQAEAELFNHGERMIFSFNKDVKIIRIDFNRFDSGEVFVVVVDGVSMNISHDVLTERKSDYLDTDIVVNADSMVEFFVADTNSAIGLDSMDVTVLDGSKTLSLSIVASNGMAYVGADFVDGAATTTHYVLQSSTNLLRSNNSWLNATAAFNTGTNWVLPMDGNLSFYRAISQSFKSR